MIDPKTVIMTAVRETFPEECEIIGPDDLNALAQRQAIIRDQKQLLQRIPGGHSNELVGIIEIVAAAIGFARELIDGYSPIEPEVRRAAHTSEVPKSWVLHIPARHPEIASRREQLAASVLAGLHGSVL